MCTTTTSTLIRHRGRGDLLAPLELERPAAEKVFATVVPSRAP
ncbi:hypothetical protein [Sinomonas sp. G460-2]